MPRAPAGTPTDDDDPGAREPTAAPEARTSLLAAFAVALAAVAVYANTLENGFVWDDQHIVVENPDTRDLSALPRVLLSPDETRPYYRPLNRASYLLDYQLFGMDPRGFHAVNVALHALNAMLLFAFARRLFRADAPALIAALLLAVHPIHSEPVNFITARNNLLALLFSLAARVLFVEADRRRSRGLAWASAGALLLGLFSKEQAAATLPFLGSVLLVPGAGDGRRLRERLRALGPHVVAAAVYAVVRTVAIGGPVAADGLSTGVLGRLAQGFALVPRYLGLVLYPRTLTIFHSSASSDGDAYRWLVAWAAIVALAGWLLRTRSVVSIVGLLWFGWNLVPILGVVPIPSTAMAERYFYVPAVGLWLIAADVMRRLLVAHPRNFILAPVLVTVFAGLGLRTWARNADWRDDVTLASSAVAVEPTSVRARYNLAVALKDRGDLLGARHEWEAALKIDPRDAQSLAQLGTLAAVEGDFDVAERRLRDALASDPGLPVAHFNLARLYELSGRVQQAIAHYERFLSGATSIEAALRPIAARRLEALRAGTSAIR